MTIFFILSCKEKTIHEISYLYIENTTNYNVKISFFDFKESENDTMPTNTFAILSNNSNYFDTINIEYRKGEDRFCRNVNNSDYCDYIYFEHLNYKQQVIFLFENYKIIVFENPNNSSLEQCSNKSEKCFIAETKTLKHDSESKVIEIVKETTITIVENQYLMADSL